jgi:hypothetical protein
MIGGGGRRYYRPGEQHRPGREEGG